MGFVLSGSVHTLIGINVIMPLFIAPAMNKDMIL